MYSFLKKYVVVVLISVLVVLLLVLLEPVFIPWLSDNSVSSSSESEKVYEVPQRMGTGGDVDKHGEEVHLTDKSASQDQDLVMSPHLRFPISRERERRIKKLSRINVIEARMEQLTPLVNQDTAYALEILELEEEMLNLQQDLGILVVEKGDPFLSNKIGRLILSNMTNDNKIPVSVGGEVVDLLVESGDIDGAATVYMATQRSMENGDEFFTSGHWTERMDKGSDVTTDPCCPDEPMPVYLEDGHAHQTPTLQPTTPQAAKNLEAELNEGLSVERFDKGRQLIDQYGTEEGLRRLRESDPDAARQFERHPPISPRKQEENKEPAREVPDEVKSSTQ